MRSNANSWTIERELVDLAAAVLTGTRDDQPSVALPGQASAAGVSRRRLATTAVLLPAPVRERWLEEWTGELSTLPSRRSRARFTIEMLAGMARLAAALRLPVAATPGCNDQRRDSQRRRARWPAGAQHPGLSGPMP
jgi:hypothetical protein